MVAPYYVWLCVFRLQFWHWGTMRRSLIRCFALLAAGPLPAAEVLIFDRPASASDHRRAYALALLKDGTLERFVLRHHGADLQRAARCGRKRVELPKRELDPALAARRALWLDPFEPRHGFCSAR